MRQASCCNRSHCGKARIFVKNGRTYARGHFLFPNTNVELPREIIEGNNDDARDSPDGFSHACIGQYEDGSPTARHAA